MYIYMYACMLILGEMEVGGWVDGRIKNQSRRGFWRWWVWITGGEKGGCIMEGKWFMFDIIFMCWLDKWQMPNNG